MIPVVYINCQRVPFVDLIMEQLKLDETRTRNTLRAVVGQRVLLAETGHGPAVCRCYAVIREPVPVRSRKEWNRLRSRHRVPSGSRYDWQPGTKVKYLYPVSGVIPCSPFMPLEGVRHGYVWMEYNGPLPFPVFCG